MYRELGDMSTQFRNSVVDAGREARVAYKFNKLSLVKIGLQALHLIAGVAFLILALAEFFLNPPYFDVVGHTNETTIPPHAFYNATRDVKGEIRRIMDLPILLLIITYFLVLVWKKGWGVWSLLMSLSLVAMLFTFLLVNYFAAHIFDWRYFNTRGIGIIIQVFSIALCWDCVVCTVFTRIDWFPFSFLSTNKPRNIYEKLLIVLWNFASILIFLFFCLFVWFSRLYYSWTCARSLDDVLLMCQFTDLVQCYPCEEADTCTHLDMCVNTAHSTFHCQTPLALLHQVEGALCIFNYNIGFFTFIIVFAYVGGTYFFLTGSLTFIARLCSVVIMKVIKFTTKKTEPHVQKLYAQSFIGKRKRSTTDNKNDDSDEELLGRNEEDHETLHEMSGGHNSKSNLHLVAITDDQQNST